MKALIPILLFGLFLALASPVQAQTVTEETMKRVEQLSRESMDLYKKGEYEKAIELLLEAYRILPASSLLYNLAKIYDKLGQGDLAMNYYKKYIVSKQPIPSLVAKATRRLRKLKEEQEKELLARRLTESKIKMLDEEEPAGETKPEPAGEKDMGRSVSRPAPVAAWLLLGGGAVLTLTGAGVWYLADTTHDDFSGERNLSKKEELQGDSSTQAMVGDVLVGAGMAAAAGGLIWLLTSSGEPEPSSAPERSLEILPSHNGVSLRWSLR